MRCVFGFGDDKKPMDEREIAAYCCVSVSTAYRWVRTGNMPPGYRYLLDLIASGRVIPDSWDGWGFSRDDALCSPLHQAFQPGELEQFAMFMSFWRTTATENDRLRDYIDYLESVTPRAPVIKFPASRTRPSLTEGHELNPHFNKD